MKTTNTLSSVSSACCPFIASEKACHDPVLHDSKAAVLRRPIHVDDT